MEKLNKLFAIAQRADAVGNLIDGANPHDIIDIAEAFLSLKERAEAAEAAVDTWRKESAYNLQGKNDAREYIRELEGKLEALKKQQPIGRVDRGAATESNEYPDAHVVCLHEHVGWEAFQDGCELFTRPAPAVSLAELVPGYLSYSAIPDEYPSFAEDIAHQRGFDHCRKIILRNIEQAK